MKGSGGGWGCSWDRLFPQRFPPPRREGKEVGPTSFSLAAPDFDKSQWLDVKFKLDLDFPNVGGLGEGARREGVTWTPTSSLSGLRGGGQTSTAGALRLDRINSLQGLKNLERRVTLTSTKH